MIEMATVDEKSAAMPNAEGGMTPQSVPGERRRRAQEVLSAQRLLLDRLENELPEQFERLAERIARDLAQSQAEQLAQLDACKALGPAVDLQLQLDPLRQQLAARQEELDRAAAQLEQARLEGGRCEQELRVCQSLLHGAQAQQDERRIEFAALSEHLADAQAQMTAARERQDQLRRELAEERERCVVQQEETKAQRRRVARELKGQRARRLAEVEQRKAELQALTATGDAQLAAQLTAARMEATQARARSNELGKTLEQRSDELAQERRKADALKDQAAQLREALKKVQAERTGDSGELAHAAELRSRNQDELKELRSRCDSLTGKLAKAELKLTESAKFGADSRKNDDLQRRFEMAVDELREMKHANSELEAKLAERRTAGPATATAAATGLDWEAQKQRLLASLEADDRDDENAVAERHTIEGTIQITDQIVAQKDQEIAELKRLSQGQSRSQGSQAAETALREAFDQDELIRQEREKLAQAVAEWREKIGKAEIAISVERAKIARDRSELEEKLRLYQREQQQTRPQDDPPVETGKPPRSRWLARLGLKELDESS
jgi:hypothetical protein